MSVNDSGDKREREREREREEGSGLCFSFEFSVSSSSLCIFFSLGRLRSWLYIFVCMSVEK